MCAVKPGVIEVTFHEDSDGFISLVGRPLTRPRTNSLSSSKIREDLPLAVSATTSLQSPTEENPTDQSSVGHISHVAAAGRGHRSAEMHLTLCMLFLSTQNFVAFVRFTFGK